MNPSYESKKVNERLKLLVDAYRTHVFLLKQPEIQMSTFIKHKLKQFNIPVVGLEENTSNLEKIFDMVEDRNAFQRIKVLEQNQMLINLTADIKHQQLELRQLRQQAQELRSQSMKIDETITKEETQNKKLQAKINGNPTTIQG
uniref:Uncharacterized protein n=1 Tax=Anopheles culicifacies TaxID=139723 RepID=A0A182MDS4_9DIPT